MKLFKVIS